jgi:hypothetical protein
MMYGVDVSRSSIAGSLRELLEFVAKVRDLGFEVKTKTRLPGGHIGTVVERDGAAYLDVKMPALYDVPPFTMSLGALRPTEGQNADAK